MIEEELQHIRTLSQQFFNLLHVPTSVSVESAEEGVRIEVQGEQLGILIGHHGETLYSLQLLLGMLASRTLGRFVPVSLEVGDWRAQREAELQDIVERLVEQVREAREPVALPAMDAAERRMVHVYMANFPDLVSESEGEGRERRVVIKFK